MILSLLCLLNINEKSINFFIVLFIEHDRMNDTSNMDRTWGVKVINAKNVGFVFQKNSAWWSVQKPPPRRLRCSQIWERLILRINAKTLLET